MRIKKPNRANKTQDKKGSSCAMCKPWKNGWKQRFKTNVKEKLRTLNEQVTEETDNGLYDIEE